MRIISGTKRGKTLLTPKDERIRPTTDRAREAVFSIIHSKLDKDLSNLNVLDIFSGTGAFGLEAASRGAKSVTFVDIDLTLTQKNATLCGFNNLSFIKKDARKLSLSASPFELIFLDAPYNQGLSEPTLENLLAKNYLNPDSLVVVETAALEPLLIPAPLKQIDERVYGAARFTFLTIQI